MTTRDHGFPTGDDIARALRRLLDEDLGAAPATAHVPTGVPDLDLLLGGGFGRGQITVVAGEPGVGASMFAIDVVRRAAVGRGTPTGVLAPDAPLDEVVSRVVSAETAIPLQRLRAGGLRPDEKDRIGRARERLTRAPLWIQAGYGVRITAAAALETTTYILEAGARLMVVDGTGPMEPDVRLLVLGLRTLAHRHRAAILLVTSSRPPGAGTPSLRDLREYDALADSVDVVVLLHRTGARGDDLELALLKNRYGPQDSVPVSPAFPMSRLPGS